MAVDDREPPQEMPDDEAAFLKIVGDICVAAGPANLQVMLQISSGQRAAGVPGYVPTAEGADEVDETGYGRTFRIGDAIVNLDDVVACAVQSPRALRESTTPP